MSESFNIPKGTHPDFEKYYIEKKIEEDKEKYEKDKEQYEKDKENDFVEVEEPKQIIKRPISDEKRKQLEKARIKHKKRKRIKRTKY